MSQEAARDESLNSQATRWFFLETMIEYDLIAEYYGTRCAERSKQPLIKHIDEGLIILDMIGASDNAKRAFCLHPLFQDDQNLAKNLHYAETIDPAIILLTMEYRNIANQYLSDRYIKYIYEITLSPLKEVNDMLVADKVQNYSDFRKFHYGTHSRFAELEQYFINWLSKLTAYEVYNKFRQKDTGL